GRRSRRQQARQGRGAGHRGLGRSAAACIPRRQPMNDDPGNDAAGNWQPSASFDALRLRARLHAAIRGFFAERGVLEVETPVMSRAGNTEPNIASFAVEFSGRVDGGPRTRWLRTSPEYALK